MLIRLIQNLISFAVRIILLPLRMLAHNFVGTLLLFGLVYLFWPRGDGTQPDPSPAPASQQQPRDAKGRPLPRIDPVTKVEDGNSRFSADILSKMTPPELREYSTVFFRTMQRQPEGRTFRWSYYNIEGEITPFSRFVNSFGHECRTFEEILKVHELRQNFRGMACQRVDGGWCRLRFDSTPLCGIAEKDKLFDGLGQKFQNLF